MCDLATICNSLVPSADKRYVKNGDVEQDYDCITQQNQGYPAPTLGYINDIEESNMGLFEDRIPPDPLVCYHLSR